MLWWMFPSKKLVLLNYLQLFHPKITLWKLWWLFHRVKNLHQLPLTVGLLPEDLELTHLLHLLGQEAFAEHKVGVGEGWSKTS